MEDKLSVIESKLNEIIKEVKQINNKVDILVNIYKEFEAETSKFKNTDYLVSDSMLSDELRQSLRTKKL